MSGFEVGRMYGATIDLAISYHGQTRGRGQLERTALPPYRPTTFRHIRSGTSIPNRSSVNSSTRTQHADSASQEARRAVSRSLKMWCSW